MEFGKLFPLLGRSMDLSYDIVQFLFRAVTLFCFLFYPLTGFAQSVDPYKEAGLLFVRHYAPKEYKKFPQNWAGIQDSRGVMVFANGDGVLKFDGVSWEFHSLPNLGVVRCVAMDKHNRIYIGAYDEIGYLDTDTLGNYSYVSLLSRLAEGQKNFGNVFKIYSLRDSMIFQTEKGLFVQYRDQFRQFELPGNENYRKLFLAEGLLFIPLDTVGLCILKGETLKKVNGGEFFVGKRVREIMPFDQNKKLILTAQHGLFLYGENQIVPFKTEIDDFLIKNLAYCGIRLPNEDYAIGTLMGGAFIIDRNGKVKSILNKSTGLGDMSVYNFCLDRQGALWATLSHGISRIETHTSITHFLDDSGPEGSVNAIDRFQGILYAGSSQGLYRLKPTRLPDTPAHFERVDEINAGVWGLADMGDALLVNTDKGTFILKNNSFSQLNSYPGYMLFVRRADEDMLFSGLRDGVSIFKKVKGEWVDGGRILGIDAETAEMEETTNGNLWVTSYSEGIFLLTFSSKDGITDYLHPVVKNFGEKDGLKGGHTRVFHLGGRDFFYVRRNGEGDQLYLFDEKNQRFIEYNNFASDLGIDSISAIPITSEVNKTFWMRENTPGSNNRIRVTQISDKTFRTQKISFSRLAEFPFRIVFEEGGISWWGGHEGMIRMEVSAIGNESAKVFELHINKISLSNDSVLFHGTNEPRQFLRFPYSLNSIRFEYAAAAYDAHHENQYQYLLEGFDNDWSAWTTETDKSYTQIPEGSYVFKIRGKNIYGAFSNIETYAFSIAPPWYRSWWMYAVYLVSAVIMITAAFEWRAGRIKKEKENLEQLVAERTQEVKAQAEQLKQQAVKLSELDKAKSHFFANISHEFRTPLTLISGGLEDLADGADGKEDRVRLAVMQKNTKRLQQLIEQLLDLSKLENGKLRLTVRPTSPANFLRAISSSFSSWAEQKKILLTVDLPDEEVVAYIDEDVIEKIVNNLLSNAIKFAFPQGKVSLVAGWDSEKLNIRVADNGPGISPGKISHIFERFYQVDDSATRKQEGSGIGLALVKELVSLHHGNVSVESRPGEGSEFSVNIPIHKKYYSTAEIGSTQADAVKKMQHPDAITVTDSNPRSQDAPHEDTIVLIVEDNIDLTHYIASHLTDHSTMMAGNGLEGLKKAIQHIPDLIISDVMMPEMDGVEMCKKLKEEEKTSHIPVILLTAKADIESRLEGLETGADDYITKPFDARELQVRVRNLITQRQNLRERFSRTVVLKPRDIAITSRDESFLEKVMAVVENHLGDSTFSVEDFQTEIGMSRMQLHRKLKALTGHSVGEFLRIQRLIRAKEMLAKTNSNVTEVCYQTGFTSVSYFSKCFKNQFDIAPKAFSAKRSV